LSFNTGSLDGVYDRSKNGLKRNLSGRFRSGWYGRLVVFDFFETQGTLTASHSWMLKQKTDDHLIIGFNLFQRLDLNRNFRI